MGPDYQRPHLDLPAAWSAKTTSTDTNDFQALATWWEQFNDPQLTSLIEEGLRGSLDLKLAQARLQQARASRQLAQTGLYPTVSASAGASRSKNPQGLSAASTTTLYEAGFDASWELDLFGATRRGIEAANADVAAVTATLESARVSLVAEIARNYIELHGYKRRISIARDNLASQSETLQITQWRYQAGLARFSEVEQARTSLEQTRASIPDLEIALVSAENRLAVLLGRNPGEMHASLTEAKALPAVPESVATGIPADVLRQRPDVVAAERTLAAETARVGQREAQRYPSLTLSGSFGWQAYSLSALGTGGAVTALGATLASTLFDGGRLRSQVDVQSAVQEQALVTYQSTVLSALEEIENALKSYAAARERLDARAAAAQAAREAAQLSRNLYQSGLADFQPVLDTQRTQLSAEDSLATADAALRTSLIALYKALGGGSEVSSKNTS